MAEKRSEGSEKCVYQAGVYQAEGWYDLWMWREWKGRDY